MVQGKATRPSGKHELVPSQVVQPYVPVKNPAIWGEATGDGAAWVNAVCRWFLDDAPGWLVTMIVLAGAALAAATIAAWFTDMPPPV